VALLAFQNDGTFEKTYWDAYTIYGARSVVIHGGFPPSSPVFLKTLRVAHDVTRDALFGALELHCFLDNSGKLSTLADLQNFYSSQQSKWAGVLSRLGEELKKRKKARALGN
jgi:hypothetical protein